MKAPRSVSAPICGLDLALASRLGYICKTGPCSALFGGVLTAIRITSPALMHYLTSVLNSTFYFTWTACL